jgi:hypothetical protein
MEKMALNNQPSAGPVFQLAESAPGELAIPAREGEPTSRGAAVAAALSPTEASTSRRCGGELEHGGSGGNPRQDGNRFQYGYRRSGSTGGWDAAVMAAMVATSRPDNL